MNQLQVHTGITVITVNIGRHGNELWAWSVCRDKDKIKKIATTLGLKMTPREFSHTDRSVQLGAIFTQWLPLAGAVLKMVTSHLPSPLEMSNERAEKLMTNGGLTFDCLPAGTQGLKKGQLCALS